MKTLFAYLLMAMTMNVGAQDIVVEDIEQVVEINQIIENGDFVEHTWIGDEASQF